VPGDRDLFSIGDAVEDLIQPMAPTACSRRLLN